MSALQRLNQGQGKGKSSDCCGSSNILSRQMTGKSGNTSESTNIIKRQPQAAKSGSKQDNTVKVASKKSGVKTGDMC